MIPLSLNMLLRQTAPFWVSLIAFLLHGEKIVPLEIIAMIICFLAIFVISLEAKKN